MLCHIVCVADLRTFSGVVLFAGSVVWFRLGSWVRVLLADVMCCRCIFSRLCERFLSVSPFLVFCALVSVKLCLGASSLCL